MASTSVYVAGCRAKLERALHHHLDLEQECAAWLSTRPYEITHEYRADAREYVIRCKKAPDPPLVIGTVIGDILANLRSCLDNLAYALAVENTGDPPSGADQLEFPVFRLAADYEKWGTRKVRWLAADAQIAIRQLQPLEDGAAPPSPIARTLGMLHELDRINKHRRLHLVGVIPTEIEICVPDGVRGKSIRIGPLEAGAPIISFATDGRRDVRIDAELSLQIGLNEPGVAGVLDPIVPLLYHLGTAVKRVVDDLSPRRL